MVTLLMFIQTLDSSHCKFVQSENPSDWLKKWFGNFFLSFSLKAHNHLIPCISHRTRFFMRDDVVSQHLKSGAHSFRILGSKKLPCFSNFPASLARPKKIVWFLLAATSNHVQVKLDCTTRINILHQQRREKWAYWFLDLQSKSRMSRIYYLQSRSSLGRFAA